MTRITRFFSGSSTTIRRLFPPCAPETTAKLVQFIVFDPKRFIESNSELKGAIVQAGNFYSNLVNTAGLSEQVKTDLSKFSFRTEYRASSPDQATIASPGRMTFPIYLFHTPDISPDSTSVDEIHQLMQQYQISAISRLRDVDLQHPDRTVLLPTKDNYNAVSESWSSKEVWGFGFPGAYYTNGSCHKLGLIKIDALLASPTTYDTRAQRFAWVLQHELGHMFALKHHDASMMNDEYDRHFSEMLPIQIGQVRDMLLRMSPN
jgi:hypothetical protein